MVRVGIALLLSSGLSFAGNVKSFMPENDLHLQDNLLAPNSNVTKDQFVDLIAKSQEFFNKYVEMNGGKLKIDGNWDDATVNAYAKKDGTTWQVQMFGGLARREEISADGFQLVICHELGHHMGGYLFYTGFFSQNMASEGQSDYYATQACGRAIWKDQVEENEAAAAEAPEIVKTKCAESWKTKNERNLCARLAMGGKKLADLLSVLGEDPKLPEFDTPDATVVTTSNQRHPKAQCRLDTYFAGALCKKSFDLAKIPGIVAGKSANTADTEKMANEVSCNTKDGDTVGVRPACWFKSLMK